MTAAFVFYTTLFFVLIALPARMIIVALLFFEHERLLWKRMTPLVGPLGRRLAQHAGVQAVKSRFPRATGFLIHRLNPRDPWGLPATLAGIVMFAGLWFFLGVLQDLVAKDPLVVLDIRLHNTHPLFRTAGMNRLMLTITDLGGAAVLSLLCLGAALIALAKGRSRLAAAFVLALVGTGSDLDRFQDADRQRAAARCPRQHAGRKLSIWPYAIGNRRVRIARRVASGQPVQAWHTGDWRHAAAACHCWHRPVAPVPRRALAFRPVGQSRAGACRAGGAAFFPQLRPADSMDRHVQAADQTLHRAYCGTRCAGVGLGRRRVVVRSIKNFDDEAGCGSYCYRYQTVARRAAPKFGDLVRGPDRRADGTDLARLCRF